MATKLRIEPRLHDPDEIYRAISRLIGDARPDDAVRQLAKLVFLLANHVGDDAVVEQAIEVAATRIEAPDKGA